MLVIKKIFKQMRVDNFHYLCLYSLKVPDNDCIGLDCVLFFCLFEMKIKSFQISPIDLDREEMLEGKKMRTGKRTYP